MADNWWEAAPLAQPSGGASGSDAGQNWWDDATLVGPAPPKPTEKPGPGIGQRLGSFATGANDALATIAGAPVDLMTGALNMGARGLGLKQIEHPIGGSDSIRSLVGGTVGRTEPQDAVDQFMYGTGAGAGSAVGGMGAGMALNAAGRLPTLAAALRGGSVSGNAAIGAGSGAGANLAENVSDNLSGNDPTAHILAGIGGGLAGGFATGLAPVAVINAKRALGAAAQPLTQGGREAIAGRALLDSATYGEPNIAGTPPLSINATLGQRSNDPGLLALERTLQQGRPQIQGELAAQASDNNQLIRGAMGELGTAGDPAQLSMGVAGRLDALRQAGRQTESNAWAQVPEDTPVPMRPLKDAFSQFESGLSKAKQRFIPNDYRDLLMGYSDSEPMREVIDLRSSLLADERGARGSGDYNRANVLRGLDEALFKGIPEGGSPSPTTADQAATLAYQDATKASRDYNATFNRGNIRAVFGRDASGADRVPDSAVAERMLGSGRGQTERVQQFVRAAGLDPDAMQGARDWFTTKMNAAVSGARQDAEGDNFVLGNKLAKFVEANRPLIDSPIFTDAQRKTITDMAEAATMAERTARAGPQGGSDTAAKLAGQNYLQTLVGGWFSPTVKSVVRGLPALAGFMYGGPGGAAAAAYAAEKAVMPRVDSVYGAANQKVLGLLEQAIKDPAFAQELMRKATPANNGFASPKLKNYLATLPATVESATPDQRPMKYSFGGAY